MLRLTAALTLLLPAALFAQTTPDDPQTPPESFGTTVPAPTTYPTEPVPNATQSNLYTAQPSPYTTEPAPVVDVDRIVVAGYPIYDTDGIPGLSPTEFASWMAQLFANAGQGVPVGDYLSMAFAQADVSKDGLIQQGELAQFLRGG